MHIGYERNSGHVYEGANLPEFAAVPAPLLTQAKLVEGPSDLGELPRDLYLCRCEFGSPLRPWSEGFVLSEARMNGSVDHGRGVEPPFDAGTHVHKSSSGNEDSR